MCLKIYIDKDVEYLKYIMQNNESNYNQVIDTIINKRKTWNYKKDLLIKSIDYYNMKYKEEGFIKSM